MSSATRLADSCPETLYGAVRSRTAKASSQPLPVVAGPEHDKRPANQVVFIDGSKRSTVLASVTIVAHHEDMVVGDHLRRDIWTTTTRSPVSLVEVRLVENLWSIAAWLGDPHDTPSHLNGLARQSDNTLDQIAFGSPGDLVQYDDVAAVWVVQPIRQLVDKDAVASVERRRHRLAFDDEMGEDKATDDEGDKQGDGDYHNPVEERTRT